MTQSQRRACSGCAEGCRECSPAKRQAREVADRQQRQAPADRSVSTSEEQR